MISEEQIQDIIDSDQSYSREYFVWQMDPANTSIQQFFIDFIEPNCEPEVLALMQHTGDFYSSCEYDIEHRCYLVLTHDQAYELASDYARESCENAFYGLPQLSKLPGQKVQVCPLTIVTACADRRTGNFISSIYERNKKNADSL